MAVASIPAKWQKSGRSKPIRLIVVHCTVSPEMGTGAEAVARYFQTSDRPGSTHLVSDNNSTVRCVLDRDTAYGAAGANSDGLHIELVGQPDQTALEWLDDYSLDEFEEAGPHIAAWSETYDIPLRWLTVAEVADGRTKGLCTHHDVSRAFPDVSTGHWDPGPNFPKATALSVWSPPPAPVPAPPKDGLVSYYFVVPQQRWYCIRPWAPHVRQLDKATAYDLAEGGVTFVKVDREESWTSITRGVV